ncbi:MAG: hypothetical protein ABIJ09_01040 [Pseudomonadota bacterium]
MTVSGIRKLQTAILADNKIDKGEVDKLINKAKDWFGVTKAEKNELKQILEQHADKFDPDAKQKLAKFLKIKLDDPAPTTPTAPPTPDPVTPGPASTGVNSLTDFHKAGDAFTAEYQSRKSELDANPSQAFALFSEYAGKMKGLAAAQPNLDPKELDKATDDLLKAGQNSAAKGYDKVDTDKDTISDLKEAARGTDPTKFDRRVMEADHQVWTTTYWPMAGSGDMDQPGSPASNLWAKSGPLDKLDGLLRARGMDDRAKALEFERKPALNWLIGDRASKGEFIPNSTISENNAEKTTGVDFDGDGKISEGVKVDFLDARGNFAPVYSRDALKPKLKDGDKVVDLSRKDVRGADGKIEKYEFSKPDGTKLTDAEAAQVYYTHSGGDGKVDNTMSVGWWGSCDKVALAGILFKDPQKDVTIDGVTFTKQDIRGLLTVLANSQAQGTDFEGNRYDKEADTIRLKSGETLRGTITTNLDYNTANMKRSGDTLTLNKVDKDLEIQIPGGTTRTVKAADIASLTHEDPKDISPMAFHDTMIKWLGEDKKPAAMDRDSGEHVWNYNFWKADLKDGVKLEGAARPTEGGHNGPAGDGEITKYTMDVFFGESNYPKTYEYWVEHDQNGKAVNGGWMSENPDFLWRPAGFANWSGTNSRNPFVDPKLVKEIYMKSVGEDNGG